MINEKQIEELTLFSKAEGAEWGEVCLALIRIWECREQLSKKFSRAVSEEMIDNLGRFSQSYTIEMVTHMREFEYPELVARGE